MGIGLDIARGSGVTRSQMKEAPRDAHYLWVSSQLEYPRLLATLIGRDDLRIIGPALINRHRFYGRKFRLVIDHAVLDHNRDSDFRRELKAVLKIERTVNA